MKSQHRMCKLRLAVFSFLTCLFFANSIFIAFVYADAEQSPEPVGEGIISYPLAGWVGYTNTGKPIEGMLVECFINGWNKRIAKTKTNEEGRFSFPKLPEGEYYLRLSKPRYFTIRTVVTTSKKSRNILDLIAEIK